MLWFECLGCRFERECVQSSVSPGAGPQVNHTARQACEASSARGRAADRDDDDDDDDFIITDRVERGPSSSKNEHGKTISVTACCH